jgi:hypothetical protein
MLTESANRNMEECHQQTAQEVTLLPKIKAYKECDGDPWYHFFIKEFNKKIG